MHTSQHSPKAAKQRGALDFSVMAMICLLAAVILIAFYAGVIYEGRRTAQADFAELQDLQKRHARTVAWLRGERTQAETQLRDQVAQLRDQLDTPQGEANAQHETLVTGLHAGTVSVRVPIVPASCRPERSHAPTIATAGSEKAYAQLDPAAAADLAAIPHDGDQAIRELNYCIDRYELLERTWQQWRLKLLQKEAEHAQAS